jgi:hypothetical protein
MIFILKNFDFSPSVMIGLPYGWRTAKIHNIRIEIPNTLRLQRNNEIISMYKSYLKEISQENMLMSDSSMIRILNVCSAERRKSIQGIDSYIADAAEVW